MNELEKYVWKLVTTPYSFGGNTAKAFDCSGLICEILKAGGCLIGDHFLHSSFDATANDLFGLLSEHGIASGPQFGAIAFYGKEGHKSHCSFVLDEQYVIEAGGGNRDTQTIEDAIRANAFVRLRPIGHRKDLVATIRPKYSFD